MKPSERMTALEIMALKESVLTSIIAWLKGKGLWEECNRDLKIIKDEK